MCDNLNHLKIIFQKCIFVTYVVQKLFEVLDISLCGKKKSNNLKPKDTKQWYDFYFYIILDVPKFLDRFPSYTLLEAYL